MPLLEPSSPVLLQEDPAVRKRTSSFSYPATAFTPNPRPAKSPRTTTMGSALRRTESVYDLSEPSTSSPPLPSIAQGVDDIRRSATILTLNRFKERRLQRQASLATKPGVPMTICTSQLDFTRLCLPPQIPPWSSSGRGSSALARAPPQKHRRPPFNPRRPLFTLEPPSQVALPSVASPATSKYYHRNTSPLTPNPGPAPRRPTFPRSKRQPNLRRCAVKNLMIQTPEGRRVLSMGARLAYSIESATRDLEAIVGDASCDMDEEDSEHESDNDVVMVGIKNSSISTPTHTSAAIPMPVSKSAPVPIPTRASPPRTPLSMLRTPSISPTNSTLAQPVLTASWVVVKGGDDWEMVHCSA
ncbi:hypothetical protein D9619_004713 [Psilocybe cf. subviscida]|uniref:Uncharacterized protein n=1 Tax=Psilocybe cf. subviscida TaxID=2480587 RepID=A0A8H5BRA7_9AGAR|nr:hypothetical protein D9619_004713 [Psilocybe cf. subviscida]